MVEVKTKNNAHRILERETKKQVGKMGVGEVGHHPDSRQVRTVVILNTENVSFRERVSFVDFRLSSTPLNRRESKMLSKVDTA